MADQFNGSATEGAHPSIFCNYQQQGLQIALALTVVLSITRIEQTYQPSCRTQQQSMRVALGRLFPHTP